MKTSTGSLIYVLSVYRAHVVIDLCNSSSSF